MPTFEKDNTNIKGPIIIPLPTQAELYRKLEREKQEAIKRNQGELYDANKVKAYENMQNFVNNNFWSNGLTKYTYHNPRTIKGQQAIQSDFDYAKQNAENIFITAASETAMVGAGQAVKYATTPRVIGQGAEAIVKSSLISPRVTKITTIPRSEIHLRNTVPGALKSEYVSSSNGLSTYTQSKVKIPTGEQLKQAMERLQKIMKRKGWREITHPNLQGKGFTNGKHVVSDLGPGNVGVDLLGRPKLVDFSIEPFPEFIAAMQRKGGKINLLFSNKHT